MARHLFITKKLFVGLSLVVAGCLATNTSPYFVRLDPVGEARIKKKYGE